MVLAGFRNLMLMTAGKRLTVAPRPLGNPDVQAVRYPAGVSQWHICKLLDCVFQQLTHGDRRTLELLPTRIWYCRPFSWLPENDAMRSPWLLSGIRLKIILVFFLSSHCFKGVISSLRGINKLLFTFLFMATVMILQLAPHFFLSSAETTI